MKTYKATFKDGRTVNYTENVLNELMLDYDVDEIMDNETGELLKYMDEHGHAFTIHIDNEETTNCIGCLNIFNW